MIYAWLDWFEYRRQISQFVEQLTRDAEGPGLNPSLVSLYFSHPFTLASDSSVTARTPEMTRCIDHYIIILPIYVCRKAYYEPVGRVKQLNFSPLIFAYGPTLSKTDTYLTLWNVIYVHAYAGMQKLTHVALINKRTFWRTYMLRSHPRVFYV